MILTIKSIKNIQKFAELFNITQITKNDLIFNENNSLHAEQFRDKLIEISPFIKKWLEKLAFLSSIILSIDKILQQETEFIELDDLKFFFKGKLFQETNVYFDTINQKFYLIRQWNSETTFIDLPNKLCQLLNIQGFEDKLRFLLKAEKEEIIRHFTKFCIEIPTNKDIITLKPLPRSGYFPLNSDSHYLYFIEIVEQTKPLTPSPPKSKEAASITDKEMMINKNTIDNRENQKNTTSTSVSPQLCGNISLHHIDHGNPPLILSII